MVYPAPRRTSARSRRPRRDVAKAGRTHRHRPCCRRGDPPGYLSHWHRSESWLRRRRSRASLALGPSCSFGSCHAHRRTAEAQVLSNSFGSCSAHRLRRLREPDAHHSTPARQGWPTGQPRCRCGCGCCRCVRLIGRSDRGGPLRRNLSRLSCLPHSLRVRGLTREGRCLHWHEGSGFPTSPARGSPVLGSSNKTTHGASDNNNSPYWSSLTEWLTEWLTDWLT